MDALSEVLKVLQFNSAIFFNARFTAPWCLASPEADAVARQVDAGSERLLFYHFFVDGSCTVKLDGMPALHLQAGDIILFPHGDAHTMASSGTDGPGPLLDVQALLRKRPDELQLGGGGEPTRIICGYLSCDPILCRPVLATLPRVLTVSLRSDEKTDWVERSFVYAVAEAASTQPGGEGVLAKLSEVLVVETLRRYVSQISEGQTGWLAGLRDRVVGKCLALMHEDPARPWTLESLAREAGTSRSVLAEKFAFYVGQPPIQYLGKWRMALASNLLRRSALSMMHIALEVGYETDTAFSRAFKREFGMPPASWRRENGLKSPADFSGGKRSTRSAHRS
ncbi:AraC family transcriptional regulator [Variovorax sp. J2P1-59]|uniref:AraC family transcriptional regulator n=1 Tax=Variovorax flavidus TaxID=3053501 RepID=UPI0025752429|nr:AraC family transcriptional regulator [Variovorax sp. J2P1-59]MDM0075099.1 AraC family transcriptional regulator [Variovorax sp. J2P1-59]